jgi:diamine N-acetyltransferase
MKILIYIRPLEIKDASISFQWRNDKQVWGFTNFRPAGFVSEKMEIEWLKQSLLKHDQKRFAICVKGLDSYIGNVQLIDITDNSAELHLFLGNKLYWGKGVGLQATKLITQYGFEELGLNSICLKVHPANIPALCIYEKVGFEITGKENGLILMSLDKVKFQSISLQK